MVQVRCSMSNHNVVCRAHTSGGTLLGHFFQINSAFAAYLFNHVCTYLWFSPLTISAHYERFSKALQSNNFPEKGFCSHEYIPSFSEIKR